MKKLLLVLFISLISTSGFSQKIDRISLGTTVGKFIQDVGPMKNYPLKSIVDTFKTQGYDEVKMVYAIYRWIASNIQFDTWAYHHPRQANHTPSAALNTRKGTEEGYANLFQTMCDMARVHCVKIAGHAKAFPETIGKLDDRDKHIWNAVKIKNTWYNIDVTWGAGSTDIKRKEFKKAFTDAWFFTEKESFFLSHFPADKIWQLTDNPINKLSFAHAPVIGQSSIIYDVHFPEGMRGKIKGREKVCKPLIFEIENADKIGKVEVDLDGMVLPAEFTIFDNRLLVEIPFNKDGKYPVFIQINGKPAFGFFAEVTPKRS